MLGPDIKLLVDKNERRIKELLNPAVFILNKEVRDLIIENERLREECPHEFKNGKCIYCGLEEEIDDK